MTSPAQRRRDPQPVGRAGELALLIGFGAVMLVGFAALVGLGARRPACSAAAGCGRQPARRSITPSVVCWPGTPAADCLRRWPAGFPARRLVYARVAVAELALLAVGRRDRPRSVAPIPCGPAMPAAEWPPAAEAAAALGVGPAAPRQGDHPTRPLRPRRGRTAAGGEGER